MTSTRTSRAGWALVAEQFRMPLVRPGSIMLDRHLGLAPEDDDRLAIVFCGEGGSSERPVGRGHELRRQGEAALLILCIDNGRAINTFTPTSPSQ